MFMTCLRDSRDAFVLRTVIFMPNDHMITVKSVIKTIFDVTNQKQIPILYK